MNIAASGGSGGSSLPLLIVLIGFMGLMYFMVIRPQSQRRKQMQQMQADVTAGTSIITIGGLYGTVVDLDDESVTLEVAPGVTNRYARGAIGKVVEPAAATEDDSSDDDDATESTDAADSTTTDAKATDGKDGAGKA